MGFFDFLKGILPEQLIKVVVDKRTINISNSNISAGDQTINDPELVKKILDKLSGYKKEDTIPFNVVHKDLKESYLDYEEISIKQKESIAKLKEVLPNEDIECILMARRVSSAYGKQDINFAKKLHEQLVKEFPKNGAKVCNLISAGYFDEMIIPFIDIFHAEYSEKYIEKYRQFYEDIIRFFPVAVFVGAGASLQWIKEELNARLNLKDVPFIKLHAIGEANIEKIEKVVSELKIDDTYSTKDKRFPSTSGLKAQIFEIKIRKSG